MTATAGDRLLDAAVAGDVPINASCNGKGSCGKCKLVVESGAVKTKETPLLTPQEKDKNYVLACQTVIEGDMTVRIPEETLEKKLKIAGMGKAVTARMKGLITEITPMLKKIPLTLKPPTMDDSISDMDRLLRGLSRKGCDTQRMSVSLSWRSSHRPCLFRIRISMISPVSCYRKLVFKGWDKGLANENFPRHTGGAIVLDGIGYLDQYMAENPEEFLDYCDWMGISMQGYPTSLERLKSLLAEQIKNLHGHI